MSSLLRGLCSVLFVTIMIAGCKRNTRQPTTIVYDRWWSSDYAANGAQSSCDLKDTQICEEAARSAEYDFLGKVSAKFQSDSTCSGLRLVVYNGHGKDSKEFDKEYSKAIANGHWTLIVDFVPEDEKQHWSLIPDIDIGNNVNTTGQAGATGEDNAQSISHAVCSIVKKTGGSVSE
jgi:hypothetical protein